MMYQMVSHIQFGAIWLDFNRFFVPFMLRLGLDVLGIVVLGFFPTSDQTPIGRRIPTYFPSGLMISTRGYGLVSNSLFV